MGTLGSYLREARESLGVDLREASQETRIALNFLKAIEEENFSKLPGEVFVKGFLKNYARFLRLSEDEVMRLYTERAAPAPAAQAPSKPAPVKAAPSEPAEPAPARAQDQAAAGPSSSGLRIELYLLVGVVVIAAIALLLVVLPARHPAREKGRPAPSKETPADQTASLPTSTSTSTKEPQKLYLDIVALEDLWVLVRTDTSPQKKAVMKQGETMTWTADERFVLSYGSAGAARILLNGKELAVSGAKEAVVRDLTITAGGIAGQKLDPEQPKPRKPQPVKPPDMKPKQAAPAADRPALQPAAAPEPAAAPVAPAVPAPPPVQEPDPVKPPLGE